jgi:hypothetical protein
MSYRAAWYCTCNTRACCIPPRSVCPLLTQVAQSGIAELHAQHPPPLSPFLSPSRLVGRLELIANRDVGLCRIDLRDLEPQKELARDTGIRDCLRSDEDRVF